jgi:hypothetical protein
VGKNLGPEEAETLFDELSHVTGKEFRDRMRRVKNRTRASRRLDLRASNPDQQLNQQNGMSCKTCVFLGSSRSLISCFKAFSVQIHTVVVTGSSPVAPTIFSMPYWESAEKPAPQIFHKAASISVARPISKGNAPCHRLTHCTSTHKALCGQVLDVNYPNLRRGRVCSST